jgi:dipeptidyl aminopeptidase/acylaminoacyl peptidase
MIFGSILSREVLLPRLAFVSAVFLVSVGVGLILTQESARIPLSPEALSQTSGVYEFSWSPDGTEIAFVSARGGASEIWLVDIEAGTPRRITSDGLPKADPQWSPDGSWISYIVRQPGGQADVYGVRPEGGEPRSFVATAADETQPRWSPDGTQLVFVSDAGTRGRITLYDLESDRTRRLTEMPGSDPQWSPDGLWVAFVSNPLPEDNRMDNEDIFLVSVYGGATRLLTPGTQRYRDYDPSWAPDSTRLAYTSEANGSSDVFVVNLEGNSRTAVTDEEFDAFHPRWSPDGERISFVQIEDEFEFHVWVVPAEGGQPVRLSDGGGVNGGFHRPNASPRGTVEWDPEGRALAYTHSDTARTSDIWLVASTGGRATPLTDSMPADLRQESRFISPEVFRYNSFDGTEVSSLIYRPTGGSPDERFPAVLFFRDSAEGQHALSWNPFIQLFVSNGYLVFAPNVRGSSGRGTGYRQAAFGMGGEIDVRDGIFGLDRLAGEGVIDSSQVGVFGAGAGGFLATAALTHDDSRFQAAVSLQGVVDLVTASSYPSLNAWTRHLTGSTPLTAPEPYYERSLTNFVSTLRTPIVFLYGGSDPEAPLQQIEQFAVQAEIEGKWFDYRVFEVEPHGWHLWRPSSLRVALDASNALLETYLRGRSRNISLTRNR